MTLSFKRSKAGIFDVGTQGFNFEDDTVGEDPANWTLDEPSNTDIHVREEYRSHRHVLYLYDNNGADTLSAKQTFSAGAQTSGIVEWWVLFKYAAITSKSNKMTVASVTYPYITDDNVDDLRVRLSAPTAHTIGTKKYNTWQHIALCFNNSGGPLDLGDGGGNLATGYIRIYVDGVDTAGDLALAVSPTFFDYTSSSPATSTVYIDAVDYSWNSGYSYNRNKSLEVSITVPNSNIYKCEIEHSIQNFPFAEMQINQIEDIVLGSLIEVKDYYTSNSVSTDAQVIFEGVVIDRSEIYPPVLKIHSRAREIDRIRPSGDYSGRTDEIISDLITDYCSYITEGTLSNGEAMGTVTFDGEKTLRTILDDFARIDTFIWYLTPEGVLYYNDASTDSGEDIDETSGLWNIDAEAMDLHINKVEINGGIKSDNTQASGSAEDVDSQAAYGVNLFKDTDSTLLTDALCNTKAASILENVQFPPKKVWFSDEIVSGVGFVQPGENYTFGFDTNMMDTIDDDQFIINEIVYKCIHNSYDAFLTSGLLFKEKTTVDIVEENSHQIHQNSDNIDTNATDISSNSTDIDACMSSDHYIKLRDEKSSGSAGGSFNSGNDAGRTGRTRTLNQKITDNGSHCTLSSNQFTLEAGTYKIYARCPAVRVVFHKAHLFNVSDTSIEIMGSNAWAHASYGMNDSVIVGEFTIASSKTFEICHECSSTMATVGFGYACSFGEVEVYTEVELWKVG